MNDTETWARDLLEHAGDTVPVGPQPALPAQHHHRWWPVLAAAAAVVLAITAAFSIDGGDQLNPPSLDRQPISGPTVPLVFGMTGDRAARTMERAGIAVTVRQEQTCSEVEGRVISTDPRQGGPSGGHVTLTVSGPKDFICPTDGDRAIAWQLIDLATGRGPGPERTTGCCPAAVMQRLARAATRWAPTPGVRNVPSELRVVGVPPGFELDIGANYRPFRAYERFTVQVRNGTVTSLSGGGAKPVDDDAAVTGTEELVSTIRAGKPWPLDGVAVYVDGERRPELDGSWDVCPSHPAVACPVDTQELIRDAGAVDQRVGPPGVPCSPATPLQLDGLVSVTVTPTESTGCGDQWAVQLWWTEQGALEAVNVLLGEP